MGPRHNIFPTVRPAALAVAETGPALKEVRAFWPPGLEREVPESAAASRLQSQVDET